MLTAFLSSPLHSMQSSLNQETNPSSNNIDLIRYSTLSCSDIENPILGFGFNPNSVTVDEDASQNPSQDPKQTEYSAILTKIEELMGQEHEHGSENYKNIAGKINAALKSAKQTPSLLLIQEESSGNNVLMYASMIDNIGLVKKTLDISTFRRLGELKQQKNKKREDAEDLARYDSKTKDLLGENHYFMERLDILQEKLNVSFIPARIPIVGQPKFLSLNTLQLTTLNVALTVLIVIIYNYALSDTLNTSEDLEPTPAQT